jgi:hypothetical protein
MVFMGCDGDAVVAMVGTTKSASSSSASAKEYAPSPGPATWQHDNLGTMIVVMRARVPVGVDKAFLRTRAGDEFRACPLPATAAMMRGLDKHNGQNQLPGGIWNQRTTQMWVTNNVQEPIRKQDSGLTSTNGGCKHCMCHSLLHTSHSNKVSGCSLLKHTRQPHCSQSSMSGSSRQMSHHKPCVL